ncbi:MAG: tRNA (adenosine(37)-N6)-threonylcarbamoyltransferase complex transferase subunit TsaD [Planctomycetes bacterium]|nr:tRNA (adenosine(37)-N6)-threonylcarbamoyltransferase complex transferase subunit TsaD [Planctomycetota bacterium]
MQILGIETSCDETAAAVVDDGDAVLANVIASQEQLHLKFGGIVPEIACRAHIRSLIPVLDRALHEAGATLRDIDAVAVANRPGLIGALLIGVTAAKTLAWVLDVPFVALNHLEAHLYACNMSRSDLEYPVVSLLVSGGHTSLWLSRSETDHTRLGATLDDAAGEAFDKVASVIGLGYLGGPRVDAAAKAGDPDRIAFPRTYLEKGSLDFSFSGLKTAVLYHCFGQDVKRTAERPPLPQQEVADIAAGFQEAVVDVLVDKALLAARREGVGGIAIGGGVAANSRLRERLTKACAENDLDLYLPAMNLCTDNAAMVAGLAYHKLQKGQASDLFVDATPTGAPYEQD